MIAGIVIHCQAVFLAFGTSVCPPLVAASASQDDLIAFG